MTYTAETVSIEIIAKLAKAKADVQDLDTTFTSSTDKMQRSAKQLEGHLDDLARNSTANFDRVGKSALKGADDFERASGRIANARRNIGRQVADVGVGLAGGQNPALIFAQQAPQIADALADTGGKAAKVAAFFAGPWGAAILAAGSILGTALIPRLLEGSDAADTMTKAQIDLARFVDSTTGAINRQTTAVQRLAAAQARQGEIESGTRTHAAARNSAIGSVAEAGAAPTAVLTADVSSAPVLQDDPIRKRLRELAVEAVRARQPINDFALAVRQAVGDRPEYRALVKTVTAQAAAAVEAAQGVQKLKAEQAVLTGTATNQQKALLGLGLATTSLVEKQVALATSTSAVERARARLALVQESGRGIQAGDAKALGEYRAELTSAQRAVNAAEAAEKAAAQAKRDHAKASREAAKAAREHAKEVRIAGRAERELLSLQSDRSSSLSDLTLDPRLQDQFARQRINLDRDGRISDLGERRDRHELSDAEFEERKKVVEEIATNRRLLVDRNASIREANNEVERERQKLGNQQDLLRAQEGLARTAKDRRRIELQLLDLGIEEQRLTAQKVIDLAAQGKASPQEAALARGTLDALPQLRQYGAAVIERNNQGPLQAYLSEIPRTGDEVNEALGGIAVNGIDRLNDSLSTAAANFLHLRGVVGDAISGIIADLARLYLRRGILTLLGSFLPGAGAGGVISGIASPFADALTGGGFSADSSGLPKLATGGTIKAGGLGGVDRNVLSVNGVPRAMIGAHETLRVDPNFGAMNMSVAPATPSQIVVQQTVHVDASNSVNPAGFEQRILSQAKGFALQVGQEAVNRSLAATPDYLRGYQQRSA